MRLPKDQDNWTGEHADKAIEHAKMLFKRYENKVDFSWSQEKIDDLYQPYLEARNEAIAVARVTGWRLKEAEMLP